MRKHLLILAPTLFYLIMLGCDSNDSHMIKENIVYFPIKEVNKSSEKFNRFIGDVEYIKLETRNSCLIGKIEELRFYKNDIYLIEVMGSQKRLLRFNNKGVFLNQIGEHGKGPEEIMNPRDYILQDSVVEIWSRLKMSKFSVQGNFIENLYKAHIPGPGFTKLDGFYYLFHSLSPPNMITKHNAKGKQIESYIPYKYSDASSAYDKVIRYDNEVKFFSSVHDTVYALTDKGVSASVIFRYENNLSPRSVVQNSQSIQEFIKNIGSKAYVIGYNENRNIILISYVIQKNKRFVCLYDKSSKLFYYFKKSDFYGPGQIPIEAPLFLTDDNKIVIPCFPNTLMKYGLDKNHEVSPILPADNPILIVLNLQVINEN